MITVTATLSGTVSLTESTTVTVTVGDTGDSATEGTDYTTVDDFTVVIDAGDTSGTGAFRLMVAVDTVFDPNETVTVSGMATGFTVTSATPLAINDQNTAPSAIALSLSQSTPVAEGDSVTVTVTAAFPGSVTLTEATMVTVAVGAGTDSATEGTDYGTVADLTVTIAAGATRGEGTFQFAPTDDTVADPGETVTVSGSAGGFTFTNATLTIDDTDTAPTAIVLSLSQSTPVAEGASATVTVTAAFPGSVTLTEATVVTVAVGVGTDSAIEGTDYGTVADITVTIAAGATRGEGTFQFAPTDDTVADPGETVTVSGTAAASFGTIPPVTLTIDNTDTAPTAITLSTVPTSVPEGATTTVTVTATLSGNVTLTSATEVMVSVAAGTAQASDFTAITPFPVTIAAGATSGMGTVDLTVTDNTDTDPDKTLTVSGTVSGFDITSATLTIIDNDQVALGEVTLSESEVSEGTGPVTVTVTVSIVSTGTDPTTVAMSVADGATNGATAADYTATPSTFNIIFQPGVTVNTGTFVLMATGDDLAEEDETIDITASVGAQEMSATLRIINDAIADHAVAQSG